MTRLACAAKTPGGAPKGLKVVNALVSSGGPSLLARSGLAGKLNENSPSLKLDRA